MYDLPGCNRAELFRRIAFTILISNTDDHFRNHGFLWTGRKGWVLSPAYDINSVPNGLRVLPTRIDFDEATASTEILGIACQIPMKIPSERQALVLMAVYSRLKSEGCNYEAK